MILFGGRIVAVREGTTLATLFIGAAAEPFIKRADKPINRSAAVRP